MCQFRINEIKESSAKQNVPVIFLNAGDTYTGTAMFTLFKQTISYEMLNLLKPDAAVKQCF